MSERSVYEDLHWEITMIRLAMDEKLYWYALILVEKLRVRVHAL